MASLHKLLVQGVRSFGANEKDAGSVQFQKPLTLIVGPNGTGKTTLIECLRYVTSGEVPPGNLGVFIHDIGVAKTSRVDAMVKLSLERPNNQGRVDATRRMTSQRRGKKLTSKSDEATITRYKPDKTVAGTISSKVADMNREMCNLLGVSKAVLTNVIFCHQEQSNWPLGEPKKVKETFDEIFSAERYTKAVDTILKLRTEKMGELKIINSELSGLRRFREEKTSLISFQCTMTFCRYSTSIFNVDLTGMRTIKADQKLNGALTLQSEKRTKEVAIVEMEGRLETIKAKIEPMNDELKKVCHLLETSERDRAELRTKKEHRKFLSGEVSHLKEQLGDAAHLFETLDDVEREIAAFKDNNRDAETQLSKIKCELRTVDVQSRMLKGERDSLNQEIAKLEYENRAAYDKRNVRDSKLREIIEAFTFEKIMENEVTSSDIYEVIDMLNTEKEKAATQLAEAKTARDLGKHKLHEHLAQCSADITTAERGMREADGRADEQRRKIANLERELESVADAKRGISAVESEYAAAVEGVSVAERALNETETESSLAKYRSERETLDRKVLRIESSSQLRQLQETSRSAHAYNEKRAALRNVENQLTAKKRQCEELSSKHTEGLTDLLGYIPRGKICPSVDDCRQAAVTAARRCENTTTDLRQQLAEADESAKFARRALDSKTAEIKQIEQRIVEATGTSPDIATAMRTLTGELAQSRSELADYQGSLVVFRKMENEARKRRCCPLCETGLNVAKDGERLLEKLRVRITDDLPSKVSSAQATVASLEKRHEQLLCLKPDQDRMDKLKLEAGQLQKSLDDAVCKRKEARLHMEQAENELESARRKCDRIDTIRPELCLLDSAKNDLIELETGFEDARSQMSLFLASHSELNADLLEQQGGMEKLHKELEQCQRDRDSIERQCQKLSDSLNIHRNKLAALRDQRSNLHQRLLSLRSTMQAHSSTDALLRDAKVELQRIIDSAHSSSVQMSPLKRQRAELQTQFTLNSGMWDRQVDKWAELTKSAESELNALNDLHAQVERYEMLGVSGQLEAAENRAKEIDSNLSDAEARTVQFKRELERLSHTTSERQLAQRRLTDNKALITRQTELARVQSEIEEAEKRLCAADLANVDEVIEKKTNLTEGISQLQSQLAELNGELRIVRGNVADLKNKLHNKNYANIETELIEKHARHFVLNEACMDLQKYAKVLDMSIMKFHSSKMEEINVILHDYWKVIYNGNDIDYVQIRSEVDDEKVSQKRRTYNYRVVMINNGVEMDMRARCSAGQKVLASILVRIALAEVFCNSCSILTLDEPTTNLDRDKVSALADALSRLVAERRQAGDLQLVVITHDAKFGAHIIRACQPEVFYRLEKDENGKTKINCLDAMQSLDYLE